MTKDTHNRVVDLTSPVQVYFLDVSGSSEGSVFIIWFTAPSSVYYLTEAA